MEKLFKEGAKDVFFTPVFGKKNRPSYLLTVICSPLRQESLTKLIFNHTSTIGVRHRVQSRTAMCREYLAVHTKYGNAIVKRCTFDDITRNYIEYENAKELAEKKNLPLSDIINEINKSL